MRRPLLLLVLLLLLGGCEAPGPGGPVPLPLTVFTSTTVQAELPTDAPLRLSLSFRGSAGIDTPPVTPRFTSDDERESVSSVQSAVAIRLLQSSKSFQ